MKLTRIALAWLVAALVAFGTAGTGSTSAGSTSLVQGNHFSHHFLADDIGPESGLVS